MNANTDTLPKKKIDVKKIIRTTFVEFGSILAFIIIYLLLFRSFKYYNDYNSYWPIILGFVIGLVLVVLFIYMMFDDNDPGWSQFGWSMFWICPLLPFIILNLTIGTFSINHPWLTRKPLFELVLDGAPITNDGTRWLIPARHDIQIVPLNQNVDITTNAKTKDGLSLQARVVVNLRRADNPALWKDPARYETSLQRIIEDRFRKICAEIDSKSTTTENLQLAFQLLDNGEGSLKDLLPPNVQLNGAVYVSEITAFQKE